METLLADKTSLVVFSYFLAGTLYLIYFFLTLINKKLTRKPRFGFSSLFLAIGLFFYNEGGKLYTEGVYEHLNSLAILLSLLISLTGMVVVYIIFTSGKE